jgi:hypothetical protein
VADDLIQNPSPSEDAGDARAQPPTQDEQQEEQQAAAASAPARVREGVLVRRFRFVYALLALLIGVSVGGFIVLRGHDSVNGPPWSAWVPSGSDTQEMKDIAKFVGSQYRLDDGSKLVNVDVSRPPSFQQVPLPVKYMVIQTGATSANVVALHADHTVAYNLCGTGASCAIGVGTPTIQRGQLVRREALELALYTLKYVSGVDSVVAVLPPRAGTKSRFAAFFTKKSLESALDEPLAKTLATRHRITPGSLFDTSVVKKYADPNVFAYSFGQAQDGGVYMALQPLQAAAQQGQQQQQQQQQPRQS